MSADSTERFAAFTTGARDPLSPVKGPRPLSGTRKRRGPEAFAVRTPAPFGVGAGRLGTTLGRAMLAWPGRDPLPRSDRR